MSRRCVRLALLPVALALLAGCSGLAGLRATDAAPQRLVLEDDLVRIDELRLRGQTQRVTVQPKAGAGRAYDILLPPPGADSRQHRDAAGQRVWPVLSF